jgi:hypothetical protein
LYPKVAKICSAQSHERRNAFISAAGIQHVHATTIAVAGASCSTGSWQNQVAGFLARAITHIILLIGGIFEDAKVSSVRSAATGVAKITLKWFSSFSWI